jgi:hypothetical protein
VARQPLNVDDYVPTDEARTTPARAAEQPPEEPQATLYLRCPLSVADRFRSMAHDRTKGRRKRTTQNDLLLEAALRYLEAEGY